MREERSKDRRQRNHSAVALLLAVALACSANRAAYITVGATVKTVDLAMKTWASYVVAGHATVAQENDVRVAYGRYQETARTMAVVLEATNATPTPEQVSLAAQAVISLVSSLTGKRIEPVK